MTNKEADAAASLPAAKKPPLVRMLSIFMASLGVGGTIDLNLETLTMPSSQNVVIHGR